MAGGSSLNEAQRKPVLRALNQMECLSKAQVTQDVHGEVAAPVAHVLGDGPSLLTLAGAGANLLAEGAHILQDVPLHPLHGAVTEGLAHDAPLAGVQGLVARVVGVGDGVGEGVVELGLADVGLEAVDVLESGLGVEADAIGAEAHGRTVALVQAPELQVPVALVGVVELVGVCELGQERAWVLGQWVEVDAVDGKAECLRAC